MQLIELWRHNPTPATATFVVSRFEKMDKQLRLDTCRLAVLRSFTLESLIPLLRAEALVNGLSLQVRVGDFNAYPQEILQKESWLYSFHPKVVILAVQLCDIAPEMLAGFSSLTESARRDAAERATREMEGYIECFRQRCNAAIIVHSFEQPAYPSMGTLDSQGGGPWTTQRDAIQWMNTRLREAAARFTGIHVLDYDSVIAQIGRRNWYDARRWLSMRLPFRADAMAALSAEWLRYLHPLSGRVAKVLVTDLDNTLWGGILGEDGFEKIDVGRDLRGCGYRELQSAMLDLYHRGVLLAIASKNNRDEALHAITNHPGMILRPQHFAATRINWKDKASNLRELAAELNVGLESLVFVDDNPAERQNIRLQLPEVTVLDLPRDPLGYASALRECPLLERLTLSEEDKHRTEYYLSQTQREESRMMAASVEEYYTVLDQEVTVAPVTQGTVARTAQLTNKTNQFNLTTRRYGEAEVQAMMDSPEWDVYTVNVTDRFGDNGLVGVCICHTADGRCEIDTLLLSCRVIGRTVETALLSYLTQEKRAAGLEVLEGWFVPTRKNAPARDFYKQHGFQCAMERDGATLWRFHLQEQSCDCPKWIRLRAATRKL